MSFDKLLFFLFYTLKKNKKPLLWIYLCINLSQDNLGNVFFHDNMAFITGTE